MSIENFKQKMIAMIINDLKEMSKFEDVCKYFNEIHNFFEKYDTKTIIKAVSEKME